MGNRYSALEYVKDLNRLCKSTYNFEDVCSKCVLDIEAAKYGIGGCVDLAVEHPEKMVKLVHKWAKENRKEESK